MQLGLKYLIDKQGKKFAVQIPIKDWHTLYNEHQKLLNYEKMSIDLSAAIREINLVEKGKREPRTLKQFLQHLN